MNAIIKFFSQTRTRKITGNKAKVWVSKRLLEEKKNFKKIEFLTNSYAHVRVRVRW